MNFQPYRSIFLLHGISGYACAVIMYGKVNNKWAMVAAGSDVLEDVLHYVMVAGNPTKIIKSEINY